MIFTIEVRFYFKKWLKEFNNEDKAYPGACPAWSGRVHVTPRAATKQLTDGTAIWPAGQQRHLVGLHWTPGFKFFGWMPQIVFYTFKSEPTLDAGVLVEDPK